MGGERERERGKNDYNKQENQEEINDNKNRLIGLRQLCLCEEGGEREEKMIIINRRIRRK